MSDNTKTLQRAVSANSLANLRPSRPGMTNNLNGRPKGSKNISTILRQMLGEIAPDSVVDHDFIRQYARNVHGRVTIADAISARLCYMAVNGDLGAIKEIANRIEGRPNQRVDLGLVNADKESAIQVLNEILRAFVEVGNRDCTAVRVEVVRQFRSLNPEEAISREGLEAAEAEFLG